MEWNAETITRLYELHNRYVDSLKRDVIDVNRSLGASNPAKTGLDYLTRAEFETLLNRPVDDPEAMDLWLRRMIRGREHEFPELQAAG